MLFARQHGSTHGTTSAFASHISHNGLVLALVFVLLAVMMHGRGNRSSRNAGVMKRRKRKLRNPAGDQFDDVVMIYDNGVVTCWWVHASG